MPLPTAALDAANTIKPVFMWAVITPEGGSAIEIPAKKIDPEGSVNTVKRIVPQGDFLMPDRVVPTTKEQSYTVTTEDFVAAQRALAFGNQFTEGTCQIFATDPADAVGKVKAMSNVFNCSVLPGQDFGLDRENFSEYSFKIEATEIVVFEFDADIPA